MTQSYKANKTSWHIIRLFSVISDTGDLRCVVNLSIKGWSHLECTWIVIKHFQANLIWPSVNFAIQLKLRETLWFCLLTSWFTTRRLRKRSHNSLLKRWHFLLWFTTHHCCQPFFQQAVWETSTSFSRKHFRIWRQSLWICAMWSFVWVSVSVWWWWEWLHLHQCDWVMVPLSKPSSLLFIMLLESKVPECELLWTETLPEMELFLSNCWNGNRANRSLIIHKLVGN